MAEPPLKVQIVLPPSPPDEEAAALRTTERDELMTREYLAPLQESVPGACGRVVTALASTGLTPEYCDWYVRDWCERQPTRPPLPIELVHLLADMVMNVEQSYQQHLARFPVEKAA